MTVQSSQSDDPVPGMNQAGANHTDTMAPVSGKESRRILLLCTALVVSTLVTGYISTLLAKKAFEDLEADREKIMQHRVQVGSRIARIEHNLGHTRATINNLLYRHGQSQPHDGDTLPISTLNSDIRSLQNLLPSAPFRSLSEKIDHAASDLAALHYSAINWRTLYDLHVDEIGVQQPLASVREHLYELELHAASVTFPGWLRPHPGQPFDIPGDTDADAGGPYTRESGNPDRAGKPVAVVTIQAELTDIKRQVDSLATSSSLDALAGTRNRLEAKFESVRQRLNAVAKNTGTAGLYGVMLLEDIATRLFGHPSADHSRDHAPDSVYISLYDAHVRELALQQEREKLHKHLDALSGRVSEVLASASGIVQEHLAELDTIAKGRLSMAQDSLIATQVSSAGIFLLIVAFILHAVRKQINQLTTLKLQAEGASRESNRYMQRMQASETRHRTIMDTMSSALITTDGEGNIETFNIAAEQLFGYGSDEMIGKTALTLIPERKRNKYFVAFTELMRNDSGNTMQKDIRIIARRRDGSEFPVSLAFSDMIIDGRRMINGIVMDITDRCEAEAGILEARDKAEASDRTKSEFLATMSHEIRTPMNGIIGMTELLLKSRLNSRQHRLASGIHQSGRLLLHLINDILDLSRIEANRLQLDPVPFDIHELITETGLLFHEQAKQKGLELHCDIAPGMHGTWIGDTTRLRQIIINLMANAIKFTDNGSVTLNIEVCDESQLDACFCISVRDTGIGIGNEAQKHIFESFSQADGSTTRRYGGSGLGLTICRKLVNLMGGEIGIRSGIGAGSEFWFTVRLPRAEVATTGTGHLRVVRSRKDSLDAKILLVEDNPVNREVATYMLESMRCEATVAADGVEALSLLETGSYDLILMDCQMPVMDGYEATRTIRARELEHAGQHIPIIALTANALSDARDKCLAAGMDDYLSKPLTMEAMYATLKKQLRRGAPRSGNNRQLIKATPAASAGADGKKTLDPAYLDEYRAIENGDQLMERIIDVYLESAPGYIRELRTALQRNDAKSLSRTAHMFKSSNAQLGAEALAELCTRLDRLGRGGATHGAEEIINHVEQEFSRVNDALLHARIPESGSKSAALEIVH